MMKRMPRGSRAFKAGLLFILLTLPLGAFGQELKLGLSLTVPEGNWFVYDTDEGYHSRFGFLGLAAEFRYYYLRDAYLALHVGTVLDFFLPFIGAYDSPQALIPDYSGRNELSWGLFSRLKTAVAPISDCAWTTGCARRGSIIESRHGKREKWRKTNHPRAPGSPSGRPGASNTSGPST